MGILIEGQRADGEPGRVELDSARAAQDRLDSQHELLETEGLGQVVVTTTRSRLLVGRVVPRRQEDDRHRRRRRLGSCGRVNPSRSGNMTSSTIRCGLAVRVSPSASPPLPASTHLEPPEAQRSGDQVADFILVLDDQNRRLVVGERTVAAGTVTALVCRRGERSIVPCDPDLLGVR